MTIWNCETQQSNIIWVHSMLHTDSPLCLKVNKWTAGAQCIHNTRMQPDPSHMKQSKLYIKTEDEQCIPNTIHTHM